MHAGTDSATDGQTEIGAHLATTEPRTERATGAGQTRPAPVRRAVRLASYLLLGFLSGVLVLAALATVPALFGFHVYTIDGGTTTPSVRNGSAVVTTATDPKDLKVGHVIALAEIAELQPGFQRIVEIALVDGERSFVTDIQRDGGANGQPILLDQPVDKLLYSVPLAGYVLGFAQGLNLLAVGVVLLILSAFFLREGWRSAPREQTATDGPAPTADGAHSPGGPTAKSNTLSIVLADVPNFQALLEVERALAALPMAERADLIRCQDGDAWIDLLLQAPAAPEDIVAASSSAGHELIIQEARTDAMELRMRYVAPTSAARGEREGPAP